MASVPFVQNGAAVQLDLCTAAGSQVAQNNDVPNLFGAAVGKGDEDGVKTRETRGSACRRPAVLHQVNVIRGSAAHAYPKPLMSSTGDT